VGDGEDGLVVVVAVVVVVRGKEVVVGEQRGGGWERWMMLGGLNAGVVGDGKVGDEGLCSVCLSGAGRSHGNGMIIRCYDAIIIGRKGCGRL